MRSWRPFLKRVIVLGVLAAICYGGFSFYNRLDAGAQIGVIGVLLFATPAGVFIWLLVGVCIDEWKVARAKREAPPVGNPPYSHALTDTQPMHMAPLLMK